MAVQKQDSNLVGFYKIRETVLGEVPATGTWQTREPNSFDALGGEYVKTARRPFSPSRQRKKGSVTDLNADGGYNEDVTQNNLQSDMEEFFFADMRRTPELVIDAVAAGYNSATAVPGSIAAGAILLASGFAVASNNGMKVVSGVTGTLIETTATEAAETPPAGAKVKLVGHTFPASDLSITDVAGTFQLNTAAGDFRDYDLVPGMWVFIGGDTALSFFPFGAFYARIAPDGIAADGSFLTLDKATATVTAQAGTGLSVPVYFSDVIKNEEDPDLIKRFSSTLERTIGRDDVGTQSEFLTGAVANELTWTSPLSGLVNVDMGYIAQRANTRTGTEGPLIARASNTVLPALGEDAFNTASNIFRLRMSVLDAATLNPTPLFARVTEWSLTFNNNVTPAKAQGVLGSLNTITGNFDVDGSFSCYFSTVEAIHAVRCNADVTFDAIYCKNNAGLYIDLPLVGLGGGRLNIEQDAAIIIPVETMAAESNFGHTALMGWFSYLPNAAMAEVDC